MTALVYGCGVFKVTQYYEKGALATGTPPATEIGRNIFAQGGNAFDVAVAVGFVMAVVYPEAGNVGGGGFAVIREGNSGLIKALDFREVAPSAATEKIYLDSAGEVIENLSTYGARAVGVPGTVAGLYELWQKRGRLAWEELVRAAADLADTGFIVDAYLAGKLYENKDQLSGFPETSDIFCPRGEPLKAGERLVLKDLASTLYIVAAEGPAGFYEGLIADKIDSCMKIHGGLITKEDLAAYKPVWREPLHFRFDSLDIYSMPPPSSGGIALGQILKIVEPHDFSFLTVDSPDYIHLFCEAARRAFADRSQYLGDPAFYQIPSRLLDEAYLDKRRETITMGHASNSQLVGPGLPYSHESNQTTHFSVCDREGNMVALTYTLNTNFGSKLVVRGAGFLLNNQMDDFALKPGYPNTYGLVGAEANKVEPGKRMLSSMAPTLVLKNQKPFLILGSRGGSKIITTVAQVILNMTRFGLNPVEAVNQPRVHHQWLPDKITLEKNGYSMKVKQTLIRYGHNIEEEAPDGDVELIYIDPLGLMNAASDPRRQGCSGGY
ncbi:MAG: gamma-glutamyltransferase [candidate division Zixibacteria bacterium]|nr:gamma-glutamyltransferase [candidate division Zixibacteria bacterium]MDD5425228.1 gamma-glutamyltransferase [candidate division Zixibacteria bacterium]